MNEVEKNARPSMAEPHSDAEYIHSDGAGGYRVRFLWLDVSVRFSLQGYGSQASAFEAAKAYRDHLLANRGAKSRQGAPYTKRHSRVRPELLAGVWLEFGNKGLPQWKAWVHHEGANRRKAFSILKHGYAGAYRKAVEARLLSLPIDLDPDDYPAPPPTPEQYTRMVKRGLQDIPLPAAPESDATL